MILKKKNCTETLLIILAKEFALSKVDEPRKSPFKKKKLEKEIFSRTMYNYMVSTLL